jgi:predicted small lipoprotein YifL
MKICLSVPFASLIALAACGARTSLEVPEGASPPVDAGPDVEEDSPDVPPVSCEEVGITFIYVISLEDDLYRFYPPDLSFAKIGHISCSASLGETPYSMAVDRKGKAYVVFADGQLFTVSTANAACQKTSFKPGQTGFDGPFGMGFSADKTGLGETLFISGQNTTQQLGTIDTTSLDVTVVGPFSKSIGSAELTGTGDARLFAFGIDQTVQGSHLAEIDKSSAKVLSDTILPFGQGASAWAFAFWGGDFYFFTSQGAGSSQVSRYHPEDGSLKGVAQLDRTIVGAGVSTCAPQ